MKANFEWMDKPVTWRDYLKLCAISGSIAFMIEAVVGGAKDIVAEFVVEMLLTQQRIRKCEPARDAARIELMQHLGDYARVAGALEISSSVPERGRECAVYRTYLNIFIKTFGKFF